MCSQAFGLRVEGFFFAPAAQVQSRYETIVSKTANFAAYGPSIRPNRALNNTACHLFKEDRPYLTFPIPSLCRSPETANYPALT